MTAAPGSATTKDGRTVGLENRPADGEYVALLDGHVVAAVGYQATDEIVVFTHTGTEPAAEGQGIASALVRYALDDVRTTPAPGGAAHRKVIAVCPFVAAYLARRREEYGDLDYRSRTPQHVSD